MASYEPYLPVMVDFKKKTQKLRFLVDKTAAQTVSAIMKKLGVKDDPSTWGLFRLSRQHWLKQNQKLRDMDIIILETLVLCPRKDYLGIKIKQIGLGAEMRPDESRILRIETTLGTHKVMKYDFNTTPDQLMEQIVKKDPIPDIQNYVLWFDDLHTYLQSDQPVSVYQIPNQGEVKMRKARVRFNVEIRNPSTIAKFNVCMPVHTTVPDAIEYFFAQLDPKAAATIKTDKDRAKVVRTFGLYIASEEVKEEFVKIYNEHGLVMTPDRTIESYKLHPTDTVIFKRRPKDTAELLLQSSDKLRAEAAHNTFVRIVDVQTTAQATFKFASTVTVQQATSKASKKFDSFGPYGLRLPKGKVVKKPMFLEPTRLLSAYNLENMTTLEFVDLPGARITTPNDDIGDADTTRELEKDIEGEAATIARQQELSRSSTSSALPRTSAGLPPNSPTLQNRMQPAARGPAGAAPGRQYSPIPTSPTTTQTFGSSGYTPMMAQATPPSDLDVLEDLLGDVPGVDLSLFENVSSPSRSTLPPPARSNVPAMPPPPTSGTLTLPKGAAPYVPPPPSNVVSRLSRSASNSPLPPAARSGAGSFSLPPPSPNGGGGVGMIPPTRPAGFTFTLPSLSQIQSANSMPAPASFSVGSTSSLPPPPAFGGNAAPASFSLPPLAAAAPPVAATPEYEALDQAPDVDYKGAGGDDVWGAIEEMIDFDF